MDMPSYTVVGVNPKTGRNNTVNNVRALDETAAAEFVSKSKGFVAPFVVTQDPPSPASQKQIDYAVDLGIPIPMNATSGFMSQLLTYVLDYDVDLGDAHGLRNIPDGSGWARWPEGLHTQPDQVRRQIKARNARGAPIELSSISKLGVFKSSDFEGYNYLTSLEGCQCPDYLKRGLPCKHMYRLAYELGLVELADSAPATDAPIRQARQVPSAATSGPSAPSVPKAPKPWFKKWWVWLCAAIVVLAIIGFITGGQAT